ncbi:hypothetical protein BDF14DRAFT_1785387 [Spinellus fusiger]|nr:hypothetical protein BDF14DRAFT_1785387 [Spinellus fusiger]
MTSAVGFQYSPLSRHYSIHGGDDVLHSSFEYMSASNIAEWLTQFPNAVATLTLDGDTIDLPVYALRRRNAIVASLPGAPLS